MLPTNSREKKRYFKNSEPELFLLGIVIGIFLLLVFAGVRTGILTTLINSFPSECAFRRITGMYCPGCGGTRAVYALFRGKILRSFCYYPAIPYAFFFYLIFMGSQTMELLTSGRIHGLRYRNIFVYIGVGLVLSNWIAKNLILVCFHTALM